MMRKSNSSKLFVAAFVAAAFSLSAGAAFAQTSNGQDEAAAQPHSSIGSRMKSNHETKKSIEELTKDVKKQDKQEREANAELSRSRDKLAKSTRELKQAQSKDRHVASAEHKTTQAERQARQRAQGAEPSQSERYPQSPPPPDNGAPR